MRGAPPPAALRPLVAGPNGGVSTGHPLVTSAALESAVKGGNAFDAGVASLLVGGVVEQDLYSLGGEALVLVYPVSEKKVTSVVGQGWAPKAVDVDWYVSRGKTLRGRGTRPGRGAGRTARRAHCARALGHDVASRPWRPGRSSTRATASRCARAPPTVSSASSSSSSSGPTTSATG